MDDLLALAKAIPLAFAALLPVVNPLGTAIILLGLTEDADAATRRRIARAVAVNTVLLLAVVLVAGRPILGFFGISVPIGQIFYPFTFPLTVGPGGVAVAITLSAHTSREHLVATVAAQLGSFVGILAVAVVTYFCLANAGRIAAKLGPSGLSVLVRLSAFIIVCLGAEIAWNGARVLLGLPAAGG